MQRLSGLDAIFLYMETPTIHMHVAATSVFDPSTVPGGYSFEKVRELVESRLHLLPPFRRRLVEVPFQLHHPLWIEDPDFDIEYHVRRAALPAPGGAQELVGYALNSLSRQPIRAVKALRRTAGVALSIRRRNRQPDATPPPAPFTAPRTRLNTSITPRRRFAFTEVALDEVKMVKNALGGTVNDVVLALCAGALRRYLQARAELPDLGLVAVVPISVRPEFQKGARGNRVSSMLDVLA